MAYTNIDDPSAHFQSFLYTGNSSSRIITLTGNSDLRFDMYWYKVRDTAGHHRVFDTSRGLSLELYPDLTAADSAATYFSNQTANSFEITGGDSSTNLNGATYANWQWKANGGTTSSNTDGSITSTVQANQDAGFSIVTYTGTSANATVGHGLGVAPSVVLLKSRNQVDYWVMYHHQSSSTPQNNYLLLDNTGAIGTFNNYWSSSAPSSTVFGLLGGGYSHNKSSINYVAYCFAEKQGYSKFGKYVGNGNADGPFVYTGFKPAFVMQKRTDSTGAWHMFDSKRNLFNEVDNYLYANTNEAEYDGSNDGVDFLSNGFKISNTYTGLNASGGTYIYMAFAENPFVTSTGVPTTAR
jgi:hypothetical protein